MTIKIGNNIIASSTKGVLHTLGDEDAYGIKTFHDSIYASNIFDSYKVTNFISKIPYDINLEFNNGTLILKSGSKVYVPNGIGVFDAITIENDLSISYSAAGQTGVGMLFTNATGTQLTWEWANNGQSGSTWTPKIWNVWYDTTNNLIKKYGSDTSTPLFNVSFPIALFTRNDGTIMSLDQVFNGFGFIGNTFFSLPRIKGYAFNGYNENGYNNDAWATTSVQCNTFTTENGKYYETINYEGALTSGTSFNIEIDRRKTLVASLNLINGRIQLTSSITKLGYSSNDSDIVHKSGNETITGVKKFTGYLWTESSSDTDVKTNFLQMHNKKYRLSDTSATSNVDTQMVFYDANDDWSGYVGHQFETNGQSGVYMYARKKDKSTSSAIGIRYDNYGNVNTYSPTPSNGSNDNNIATTNWCYDPAKSTNLVHRSGDETITGTKTFSSTISGSISGNAGTVTNGVYTTGDQTINGTKTLTSGLRINQSSIDTTTNPTTQKYGSAIGLRDKNGVATSYIDSSQGTNGSIITRLGAIIRPTGATSDSYADLKVGLTKTGVAITSAPIPTEDTTGSRQIDTVGARNTKLANYALDNSVVKLSGNQTIAGTKTFSSTIVGTINKATSTSMLGLITFEAPSVAGTGSANVPYDGLSMYRLYNSSNAPCDYGNVLCIRGQGSDGGQLVLGWSGTDNTTEHLYYRSHRDTTTGGWGPWKTIAYKDECVATSSLAACNVVVQAYKNGVSWYRVWSDGWIEQGGTGTSHQYNTTAQNVTFLKTFTDTNYSVVLTAGDSTQQSWDFGVRIGIKYTNGLDVRGGTNGNSAYTGLFHWYACGY